MNVTRSSVSNILANLTIYVKPVNFSCYTVLTELQLDLRKRLSTFNNCAWYADKHYPDLIVTSFMNDYN